MSYSSSGLESSQLVEPVDTDPRGTGFAMVPGDPALGDLKPEAVIDVVVASVLEGLFKGLWHGDLYMVEGLAAGVWTLMGYKLAHVQSGVGYLSKDSDSHEFLRPPLELSSFGMLKELCSGIGCISVGTSFAGCKTSLYVDVSQIACDTVRLNGGTALQGNLSDRAVRIQVLSDNASARCLYSAGFPCNSYSPQGSGGGLADPRGQVLLYVLQTIWHGQAAGVILECVQQVEEHQDTMRLLALLADKMQFQMTTVRLDLAHQWCSRRQRWWAVMVPHIMPCSSACFLGPAPQRAPVLKIPSLNGPFGRKLRSMISCGRTGSTACTPILTSVRTLDA